MGINLRVCLLTAAIFASASSAVAANSLATEMLNGDVTIVNHEDLVKAELVCHNRFYGPHDAAFATSTARDRSVCLCVEQTKMQYPLTLGHGNALICEPDEQKEATKGDQSTGRSEGYAKKKSNKHKNH